MSVSFSLSTLLKIEELKHTTLFLLENALLKWTGTEFLLQLSVGARSSPLPANAIKRLS